MRSMLNCVWPKEKPGIRVRVVVALSLLIGAKIVNVQVPFLFKHLVDHLNDPDNILNLASAQGTLITATTALVLGYGLARAGSAGMNELRNAVFAKVAQNSIRRVAKMSFSIFTHSIYHFICHDRLVHCQRQ